MTGQERTGLHWAWIILGVCFVNLFVNYSARLGYGVILPEMIAGQLGFDRTDAGSIFNSYLITYVMVTPLTGYLTDRLGGRRVISACALILGIGLCLMGTVSNLGTACLYFALVGLGATGMWTSVLTVVQRWFDFRRRGLALGIMSAGYGLGFAATGVVFPLIFRGPGWRYAWYFLGAAALVMVVVNALLLRSDPAKSGYTPWGGRKDEPGPATPAAPSSTSLDRPSGTLGVFVRQAWGVKAYWLIGFSYLTVAYGLYGLTTFMVDFAKNQLGLSPEVASLLATVHGICQVAGVLIILPLSDRLGRRRTIIGSNLCLTVCLTGVLLWGKIPAMLFVLVGLTAVFYGATFPIYAACAGDYFPRRIMGTVIGSWTVFYGTGAVSAHWVSGWLRDATGAYDLAFVVNAAMVAVALVLMIMIRRQPVGE